MKKSSKCSHESKESKAKERKEEQGYRAQALQDKIRQPMAKPRKRPSGRGR